MKKIWFFAIILSLVIMPMVTSTEFPTHYNDYLNDFTKYFNANETAQLTNMLTEVRENTTAQVVVATISDCGGDYMGYATALATNWKIGNADKDNGLLILYCQNVKKLVVQMGYGLEGILPDGKIGRLLDDYYVPLRDQNKTKEGIINVTEQLVNVIYENRDEVISGEAGGTQSSNGPDIITILVWAFFAYVVISRIIRAAYKNKKKTNMPWFIPIFFPFPARSSSGGFGGGGFSGGGGFGGGGFGGGGASR